MGVLQTCIIIYGPIEPDMSSEKTVWEIRKCPKTGLLERSRGYRGSRSAHHVRKSEIEQNHQPHTECRPVARQWPRDDAGIARA